MTEYNNVNAKEQENKKMVDIEAQLKKQLVINLQLEECMAKFIERKQNDKEKIEKLTNKIKSI